MTGRPRWSAVNSYVIAVIASGSAVLLLFAIRGGARALLEMPAGFWLLLVFMLVSQIRHIVLPRSGDLQAITATTCLCLAMLLGWGVEPTALVLAASSICSDLFHRKALRKILFNAAQYAIALAAGGYVLNALGAEPPFEVGKLPAFFAAAVVYLGVNKTLVAIVATLLGQPPRDLRLWRWSGVRVLPEAILVAMAPLVLVIVERGIALALLLPLPMIAVHLAYKAAIDAEANRATAEAAAVAARVVAEEQARLARAEQAVARRLQESERLKENLLAAVSHELRTPLAGVLGAIATLDQRDHLLSPELRSEFIGMAARQGKRLKELIEDLLLAATLEQVPSERVPSPPVDASFLAREACEGARRVDPNQSIAVSLDGPLPVRAAREAVLQVLSNLLDNAARHSPEAGVIRLETRRNGEHAVISVQDAGPAVPLVERERIFERFIRFDDQEGSSRRGGGVGLGLYVSRRLARAQGGELRIGEPVGIGVDGAGARFELLLPLASEPEEPKPAARPQAPAAVGGPAAAAPAVREVAQAQGPGGQRVAPDATS